MPSLSRLLLNHKLLLGLLCSLSLSLPALAASPALPQSDSASVDLTGVEFTRLDQASRNLASIQLSSLPAIGFADLSAPNQTTVFGLPLNMGPIDRSLRALVALGLIGTGIYGLSSGQIMAPVSWTLIGVAAIPTLTASTGYCPLYQLFGLNYSF